MAAPREVTTDDPHIAETFGTWYTSDRTDEEGIPVHTHRDHRRPRYAGDKTLKYEVYKDRVLSEGRWTITGLSSPRVSEKIQHVHP